MSLEDKFNAAVNVIRSLPKSGSYQPSNELMLRFYSYFKQATEGPCDKPKPGFWDVVNRAKWESWNKLGDMSRDEAMQAYVNELHKIVETMSYSNDVASFLSVDESNRDLELVAGDVLARVRTDQDTPNDSLSESGESSPVRAASPVRTKHDSDDEFIDTVDVTIGEPEPVQQRTIPRLSNGHAHQITSQLTHLKVLEQLPGTLARLEADVAALRKAVEGDRAITQQAASGWRWPWQELSPPTLVFMFLWPFIAFKLASRMQRNRTK
ncbi:unnamed protein product [Diatraea saccharalis]|uniref:ACB domain-containing protein n=1 Tax=Diatraea saccharalis TaxID=40085 RepID=A0A9P0C7F3_9NEOP|nr:unnamed protein product [Diatraea saccharalis]